MTPSSNVPWGKVTVTAEAMEKASELAANLRKASEMAGRYKTELDWAMREIERLRAALDQAGNRLAQVQPGVTEKWALDIVPMAEEEIRVALEGHS